MVIPLHIWAHAFRIRLAAVVALYVAFWLQLGGASSAAVTVAILAQPTRGAALAKATNRIAATLIGAAVSVVITGVSAGERIGMLGAFICWICICVFVASYLRGDHLDQRGRRRFSSCGSIGSQARNAGT